METSEVSATVYVDKKLGRQDLAWLRRRPIPRVITGYAGDVLPTDVVPLGRLIPLLDGGASVGPSKTPAKGTLGTFAIDAESGRVTALTAMHLTNGWDYPPGGLVEFTVPSTADTPLAPLMGALLRGTRRRVDAAKIGVDPRHDPQFWIKGIGPVRGWRPMVLPADRGITVRMFGATSGLLVGRVEEPAIHLPHYSLDAAILVRIPSTFGDSGAALVDENNLVLGLLVGQPSESPHLRIFSPIGLILRLLQCDIPPAGAS